MIGYNRRSYLSELKNKLKNETIISAHVEAHERYWILKKIVKDKFVLKNWTYVNTSHVLNLLLFLLGDFKKVISFSKNDFNKKIVALNTSALIEFKKKIFATFKSNWNVPGGFLIKIFCIKNTYILDPIEKCIVISKKFKTKGLNLKNMILVHTVFYLQAKFFIKIITKKEYLALLRFLGLK